MIRRMRKWLAPEAVLLACCWGTAQACANEAPRQFCARIGNDDTIRPVTPALADDVRRAFGISGKYALDTTFYRCASGRVMLCAVGANLSCGKADLRKSLPQADLWCKAHPTSDVVPMAVTGHDTAYFWVCDNGVARPGEEVSLIDARGFLADNWKELK